MRGAIYDYIGLPLYKRVHMQKDWLSIPQPILMAQRWYVKKYPCLYGSAGRLVSEGNITLSPSSQFIEQYANVPKTPLNILRVQKAVIEVGMKHICHVK